MEKSASAVIFDLDNTLTDRAMSIQRYAHRFFEDFGNALRPAARFDDIHRVIQIGDGGGYRPKEVMFQEIQTDLDWVDAPASATISEHWYRVSPQCMQLRAGAENTLTELQRRGYLLGIITNGKTHVQNATLDALNVRGYFEVVLISEECGCRKPDPAIFHLALTALRLSPQCAVYVGDNPQADIQGASNAGLQSVWITDGAPWPPTLQPPQHQIAQIPQLLELFKHGRREA